MINEITLGQYATFRNYEQIYPKDINFIYGSNGSGKTIFTKIVCGDVISEDSKIEWENNKPLEILAYNKLFVKKNFDQSDNIAGIFTLGEDNKEAMESIRKIQNSINTNTDKLLSYQNSLDQLQDQLRKLNDDTKEKCWLIQEKYGNEFRDALIGSRGSKQDFLNKCLQEYDRFDNRIISTEDDVKKLYNAVYGKNCNTHVIYQFIDEKEIESIELSTLLTKKISGNVESNFGHFVEYLNNSDWIKQGTRYLEKSEGKCPFCQQDLPNIVRREMEDFFSRQYEKDCQELNNIVNRYENLVKETINRLTHIDENPIEYLEYSLFKEELHNLNMAYTQNWSRMQEKVKYPSLSVVIDSILPIIERINGLIDAFNEDISRNNDIVQNQAKNRDQCRNLIWQFLVSHLAESLKSYKKQQKGKMVGIDEIRRKITILEINNKELDNSKKGAEMTLTSVTPTVNAINGVLRNFGFEGFRLEENVSKRGTYKIIRPNGESAEETLSEGERNLVTFIYFYHLVYGSTKSSGLHGDKVILIDDPISSLDSNSLFIITHLIKKILCDCKDHKNGIKQVFLLTHNVYFHNEVTYYDNRKQYPKEKTLYWVFRKNNNVTDIIHHNENPVTNSYRMLWENVKNADLDSGTPIYNTLRRILEYYFNIIGCLDYRACIESFEGKDRIVCNALISCINVGSHTIFDDFSICDDLETRENYVRVFKMIFENTGHGGHYNMMMQSIKQ